MVIGVLALQGDFREHKAMLTRLGADVVEVRAPRDLDGVHGLIMPGGESTTIGNLLAATGLDEEIAARVRDGMAVWGTCAGAILLATDIEGSTQPRLGLIDMRIARNAYGRQVESFRAELDAKGIGRIPAFFIRAPVIRSCAGDVLASHDGTPVLVRKGNILVSTFHPELTEDTSVHAYFLEMAKDM